MFRKTVLAFALVLALALPAAAADNGFYVGLKFIDSIQSTGQISKNDNLSPIFDISDYTQNTVGGGVFIGYDFYPAHQVPLRAEIEYAIRTNSTTSWDVKGGLLPEGASAELKGQWNLQTLFLNAYWDFHNDSAFTPYVGAGIGMGFIESKYEPSVEFNGQSASDTFNDMQTVFAWNVGAGVAYAITDNLSADLAYRFVGLGYHETEKTIFGQEYKIGMAPYANEFSLGIRYTF